MLKDRTKYILESAVRDFIKTGRPVTSERLFACGDFGIKPAMIRWELNTLADAGYFFQMHPSGGRFPTNRAYRFFVNEILADDAEGESEETKALAREFRRGERKTFIDEISEYLGVLGVGYESDADAVYESGLRSLLGHLEIEGKEDIMDVVRDFELLPQRLEEAQEWWRATNEWPQVFIGASPVTKSEHLSVIAGQFNPSADQKGERFLFLAIGPKRMDYKKSLDLFRDLQELFEENG